MGGDPWDEADDEYEARLLRQAPLRPPGPKVSTHTEHSNHSNHSNHAEHAEHSNHSNAGRGGAVGAIPRGAEGLGPPPAAVPRVRRTSEIGKSLGVMMVDPQSKKGISRRGVHSMQHQQRSFGGVGDEVNSVGDSEREAAAEAKKRKKRQARDAKRRARVEAGERSRVEAVLRAAEEARRARIEERRSRLDDRVDIQRRMRTLRTQRDQRRREERRRELELEYRTQLDIYHVAHAGGSKNRTGLGEGSRAASILGHEASAVLGERAKVNAKTLVTTMEAFGMGSGPPGKGKSATAAKLAARAGSTKGSPVHSSSPVASQPAPSVATRLLSSLNRQMTMPAGLTAQEDSPERRSVRSFSISNRSKSNPQTIEDGMIILGDGRKESESAEKSEEGGKESRVRINAPGDAKSKPRSKLGKRVMFKGKGKGRGAKKQEEPEPEDMPGLSLPSLRLNLAGGAEDEAVRREIRLESDQRLREIIRSGETKGSQTYRRVHHMYETARVRRREEALAVFENQGDSSSSDDDDDDDDGDSSSSSSLSSSSASEGANDQTHHAGVTPASRHGRSSGGASRSSNGIATGASSSLTPSPSPQAAAATSSHINSSNNNNRKSDNGDAADRDSQINVTEGTRGMRTRRKRNAQPRGHQPLTMREVEEQGRTVESTVNAMGLRLPSLVHRLT